MRHDVQLSGPVQHEKTWNTGSGDGITFTTSGDSGHAHDDDEAQITNDHGAHGPDGNFGCGTQTSAPPTKFGPQIKTQTLDGNQQYCRLNHDA